MGTTITKISTLAPQNPPTVDTATTQQSLSPLGIAVQNALKTANDTPIQAGLPPQINSAMQTTAQQNPENIAERNERNALTMLVGAYRGLINSVDVLKAENTATSAHSLANCIQQFEDALNRLPQEKHFELTQALQSTLQNAQHAAKEAKTETTQTLAAKEIRNTNEANRENDAALPENNVIIPCNAQLLELFSKQLIEQTPLGIDIPRGKNDSLDSLQNKYDALVELLDAIPQDTDATALLHYMVSEQIGSVHFSKISFEQYDTSISTLQGCATLPDHEQWVEMQSEILPMLNDARDYVDAQRNLLSDNVHTSLQAEQRLEQASCWIQADVTALEQAVDKQIAKLFSNALAESNYTAPLSKEQITLISTICQKSSLNPIELGHDIADALTTYTPPQLGGTFTENQLQSIRQDFLNAALQGMAKPYPAECSAPASTLSQEQRMLKAQIDATRMQHVDMLFQHLYPAHEATALLIKQGITSDSLRDAVDMAHEYTLSSHLLKNQLLDAAPKKGNILTNSMGSLSARSFLLTPALVKSLLAKTNNTAALNYHIAHVALLQAGAMEHGLLGAQDASASDFTAWFNNLGLNAEATKHGLSLATQLGHPEQVEQAKNALFNAVELYNKGLMGSADTAKADATMLGVGKIGTLGKKTKFAKPCFFPTVNIWRALP